VGGVPSHLRGEFNKRFRQIRDWLASSDPADGDRAIATLRLLADPHLFARLLDGTRVPNGRIKPNPFFQGREAMLHAVALAAPEDDVVARAVRATIHSLTLSGAGFVGAELARVPTVTSLTLASGVLDAGVWRALSALPALRALRLVDVELAPGFRFEGNLLRRLDLVRVRGLASLAPLQDLGGLESLRLEGLERVDLAGLADLEGIQRLRLSNLATLEGAAELDAVPCSLLALAIIRCPWLTSFQRIGGHRQLRQVHVGHCPNLASLAGLERTGVDLLCMQHNALEILDALPATLVELHIEGGVRDLRAIAGCPALEMLSLTEAPVTDISPLRGARALRRARIDTCESFSDATPLAACPRLEVVELPRCRGITTIDGVHAVHLVLTGTQFGRGKDFYGRAPLHYWEGPPYFRYTNHDGW